MKTTIFSKQIGMKLAKEIVKRKGRYALMGLPVTMKVVKKFKLDKGRSQMICKAELDGRCLTLYSDFTLDSGEFHCPEKLGDVSGYSSDKTLIELERDLIRHIPNLKW